MQRPSPLGKRISILHVLLTTLSTFFCLFGLVVVFVGDAYMTIDPILAQGFTVAMEGAFATKNSVQKSCQVIDPNSTYAFDPYRKYWSCYNGFSSMRVSKGRVC